MKAFDQVTSPLWVIFLMCKLQAGLEELEEGRWVGGRASSSQVLWFPVVPTLPQCHAV